MLRNRRLNRRRLAFTKKAAVDTEALAQSLVDDGIIEIDQDVLDEDTTEESLVSELASAFEKAYFGDGARLDVGSLPTGMDYADDGNELIFYSDSDDLEKAAVEWWVNGLDGDSGLINVEQVVWNGFTNNSESDVLETYVQGELDYFNSDFESAKDMVYDLQEEYDRLEGLVDRAGEIYDDVEYLERDLDDIPVVNLKVKADRAVGKQADKLTGVLVHAIKNDSSPAQALSLIEGLLNVDGMDQKGIDQAYANGKALLETVLENLEEVKEELENDLSGLEGDWSDYEDSYREQVEQISGYGSVAEMLEKEFGLDSETILNDWYGGADLEAYAEYIVRNDGAATHMGGWDGTEHSTGDFVYVID